MTFEEPQKGNPHALTIRQHVFPRVSIARFVNDDGCVSAFLKEKQKILSVFPNDQLFYARRVWDHDSEHNLMKEIEDKFQSLAEAIIANVITVIGDTEKTIIDNFFALWNIRALRKNQPIQDYAINSNIDSKIQIIGLAHNYTKDDQERLEKNGINFIRPDLTMPGRQLTGISIRRNLMQVREHLANSQWGILKAMSGEFLVPDNFSNARVVPVSPKLCLFSQSDNADISESEVAEINKLAIESSREYYFAQDLTKCPS